MSAEFQLPSIDDLAGWVASWLQPLSYTGLGFIKWEAQSRSTGGYIAIIIVLALLVGRAISGRRRKIAVFVVALLLLLALIVVNVALSIMDRGLKEQQQILLWRDEVWKWAYVLLCASIPSFVVTVTFLVGLPDVPPPGSTVGGSTTDPT